MTEEEAGWVILFGAVALTAIVFFSVGFALGTLL